MMTCDAKDEGKIRRCCQDVNRRHHVAMFYFTEL